MFCCETLGPGIHVEVTLTCTTYLNMLQTKYITAWQLIPNSSGLFQKDNEPCQTAKIVTKI